MLYVLEGLPTRFFGIRRGLHHNVVHFTTYRSYSEELHSSEVNILYIQVESEQFSMI